MPEVGSDKSTLVYTSVALDPLASKALKRELFSNNKAVINDVMREGDQNSKVLVQAYKKM